MRYCVRKLGPKTTSHRVYAFDICYTFEHVFNDQTIQKKIFDHVAYPLVHKLLLGKDGLIITHGLTSSGKTYTITGTPEDEGLIPRSIDVIFNTIKDYQAPKFMFKSNKENGFVVQSTPEALIDQQKNMGLFSRTSTPKRTESIGDWSDRVSDSYIVNSISALRKYSVFLSYIEIYNNYIYDLLEDVPEERKYKNCSSKMLHEDRQHNMYVLGVVESEVKTADEALDVFCKGQLRRQFSNTSINVESSRSHTVFTIRVVQAPISPYGSEIDQSQSGVVVSQLSFVDLASCERIMDAQNGGRKLYETGSKNATLTALNSCIEALKKSQNGKTSKTIPYRKSKLTHLFKSFFKGKGEIRMIVCLNPRLDDCIKTTKFLKFAKATESSQSEISETPRKLSGNLGCTDKHQELIEKVKQRKGKITEVPLPNVDIELPHVTTKFDDESSYTNLIEVLKKRKLKRLSLEKDLLRRQNEFRNNLISIEKENSHLKEDIKLLEMDLRGREHQLHGAEHQLSSAEEMIQILDKDMAKLQKQLEEIRIEVKNKNQIISDQAKEIESANVRMEERLASEKRRLKLTMEGRLAAKQAEIERIMCFDKERFRQLRDILNSDDWTNLEDFNIDIGLSTETSTSVTTELMSEKDSHRSNRKKFKSRMKEKSLNMQSLAELPVVGKPKKSSCLDNRNLDLQDHMNDLISMRSTSSHRPSHRNSSSRTSLKRFLTRQQSMTVDPQPVRNNKSSISSFGQRVFGLLAGRSCSLFMRSRRHSNLPSNEPKSGYVWIEHRPIGNLDLNDEIPPFFTKRTVSTLSVKDLTKKKASHYVLQHQKISNGSLAVELYKAEIIPSDGGGAQVLFKDVVKMSKNLPRNHQLKKIDNESIPLQEVAARVS
ncbi:hypothetical protein JTE90_008695 [Oedothorax gibbosus]|uniref:Kinesin motor domain-containing protein n=1 Tax=Oedothorax gibbosus TaxID=931172 RepID=A0AAV6V0K0_9ARAC|nr:hypothetical protein JTE90_008695 [Oedothorax gibbosus]